MEDISDWLLDMILLFASLMLIAYAYWTLSQKLVPEDEEEELFHD